MFNVFRHGDRTPIKAEIYPKLPHNPIYDTLGYGQLTQKGKIKEFQLGVMLRQRYSTFLGKSYKYGSVYAYSSDTDRTKMSLQLVLAGIYPPTLNDVGYIQLFPISKHNVPILIDNLLFPTRCPVYEEQYRKVRNSIIVQKKIRRNKKFFDYVEEHTGVNMTVNPIFSTFILHHFLKSQESMDIKLPNWATEEVRKRMIPIVELEYEIQSYNMLMKRINGGHLVKEFIKNMDAERNQTSRKIYVYSGHEVNIAAFVRAHNLIEPKIPNFGSAIIVEKLRDSKGKHFVQLLVWNDKKLVPYTIPGCSKICPYEKYVKSMQDVIPSDEESNCLWDNVSTDKIRYYYTVKMDS
ncbi:hypothetical protein E2986_07459 [Frieseomelitta varia]|uniref:acid phosphatase n=1 Tax=Frieseomelitta varia TaxID=561572 RepID=A0A833RLR0_9HYME|nr:hypothetical protein E2986_07459 [Frieseomelitta varia]